MNEFEYRLDQFNKRFVKYKTRKIVLYGTGVNAKAILNNLKEYNIIGVLDEKNTGKYFCGKKILSLRQVLELGVDFIILAAQIDSAQAIYERIYDFCLLHHILLYDMYGHNAIEVNKKVLEQDIHYFSSNEEDLRKKIDNYSVVSFGFLDTLVTMEKLTKKDFYIDIEKRALEQGIYVENYVEKRLELCDKKDLWDLDSIYRNLSRQLNLSEYVVDKLLKLEKDFEKNSYKLRKNVKGLMSYAKERGKKVYLISETRLPKQDMVELLKKIEITDYDELILTSDYNCDKVSGLFRIIREKSGDAPIFHIGADRLRDGIAPQMYGIDIYLLKKAWELMDQLSPYVIKEEWMEDYDRRADLGKFMSNVFSDPFMLNEEKKHIELSTEDKTRITNIARYLEDRGTPWYNVEKPVLFSELGENQGLYDIPSLEFTSWDKPEVSIIIPVYNQFKYTYNCLKSILYYTKNVTYEVIVADDCSTDDTKELEKVIKGIQVIHNKNNLKFLLNCNNAAKCARGKYIVFLNNDTQVQPDWLSPLRDIMVKSPDVGMTGSKLIYPDGYLQEAGGILWNDGSAWNFGNRDHAERPDYNYVKDVDYISGASIMVEKTLWEELGGFDEKYAPAYYEDTDLAFRIRCAGKRVVYQPKSVVVHFEGASNGIDVNTGLKSFQITNQKKFYETWKEDLEKYHFNPGTNVLLARDRSKYKKHILVVDHYIPNYDKDAGGRCTYYYLTLFVKMGMQVTFIGDDFIRTEPYASQLEQLGIEVLVGEYNKVHWQQWAEQNLKYFDYIYLQRPHISIKYIDLVKRYSNAKVFYFTHDLHHVREYRQYLIDKNPDTLASSKHWKKIEYELFEKADVIHVPGMVEQKIVKNAFPKKIVRSIPLFGFEKVAGDVQKDFKKRKDLLFVGGFGHKPNLDGVLWFAEKIFPQVREKYPDIKWYIVGSNTPEEVLALASENIIVKGFVPDDELDEMYRNSRLVIAPLRYGAGVKGKILQAFYFQVPVVTTTIGMEGISKEEGAAIIADSEEEQIKAIVDLYEDFSHLQTMSDAAKLLIENHYTEKAALEVLYQDFKIIE